MHVSQADLAGLFGVSARTIRDWHARGLEAAARLDSGRYDLAAAFRWRLEDERRRLEESDDSRSDFDEARSRKEMALAEKHELDAAQKRSELVHVSLLEDTLLRIRASIDSLPRQMAPDVAEILDIQLREALPLAERMAGVVRREVRNELERMADEREPRDVEPTPLPDDAPALLWLDRAGIETVEGLLELEDVREVDGIGAVRADAIEEWLKGWRGRRASH